MWWRDQAKLGAASPRRIVNTTSEAGLFGSAGQANDAPAKAGIVSLTWVFAHELARYGVTANVIAPRAGTRTTEGQPFIAAPNDESFDRYDLFHVSQAVAWLASDGTSHITGQIFVVIGGDVHLLAPFQVAASIHADDGWTVETLTVAQSGWSATIRSNCCRRTWCAEPGAPAPGDTPPAPGRRLRCVALPDVLKGGPLTLAGRPRGPGLDQRGREGGRWQRPGQEVTLNLIATQLGQAGQLGLLLHPFGDTGHPQGVGQLDDLVHDGGVARFVSSAVTNAPSILTMSTGWSRR